MKNEKFEYDTFYHFYNRGNNKQNIFFEDRNYTFFLNLISKYLLDVSEIYCFCLLKNHFHLIIRIKDKSEINEKYHNKIHLPFSNMFNAYTKAINKAYERSGSLFQEHPKRIKIENEKYLMNLLLYIHLNPVKHKISDNFKNYPYSSFKIYISNKPTNLKRDYGLELFGGKENFIFQHHESKIIYEGILKEIDEYDE
uniref:transposase n=1 Tax=Flavobacterium sp. TaxID=239 RepID=UPI00404AA2C8